MSTEVQEKNSGRRDELIIRDLRVDFNGFVAINNVNLTVSDGEVRVIIGPNGAGKTTLLDLITGKTKATQGHITFRGHSLIGKNTATICRKYHIGRKFQGPNIFENMTVYQNIEVAIKGSTTVWSSLFSKRSMDLTQQIEECLEQINLLEYKEVIASSLSHGQKQWLEIGMVMMQEPRLVILDEPTAGMTAEETYKTGEMIKTLLKGRTVLVIEHDMEFVRQIAKTVTVLHMGAVLAEGTFEEIEQNPKVIQVYLKQEEREEGGK